MIQSVSYLWREPRAAEGFTAGVSLHSHTNHSKETLDFIAELSTDWGVLQPLMRWLLQPLMRWAERRCRRTTGIRPDYARSYWTPPLTPRLAFDLERIQIEEKLQMPAMVSLTDHDDIQAPMLLRSLASARQIPVSLEWTVPYGSYAAQSAFHLGIHNLPSATGAEWMRRMEAFTAIPVGERPAKLLTEMLAELDELPGVLIVFNHPLWDLYRIGEERHRFLVNDFLAVYGQFCHAVELNGLRNWDENREVATLARQWNQVLISGGDRHGVEPNANLNLTRAAQLHRVCARGAARAAEPCALHAAVRRAVEAPHPQLDAGRHPQLLRLPRGIAALGRSRLPPRRGGESATALGALARWPRAGLPERGARLRAPAGRRAGLQRPAPRLERRQRHAHRTGRAQGIERISLLTSAREMDSRMGLRCRPSSRCAQQSSAPDTPVRAARSHESPRAVTAAES